MINTTFTYTTDTASFVVFDEAALLHRLNDVIDWWSVYSQELTEVNNGNIMSLSLHADGIYDVIISDVPLDIPGTIRCYIRCLSGTLCIGPGEVVPSDGMSAATLGYGKFLTVTPGNYLISVARSGPFELTVNIMPTEHEARNSFTVTQEL